MSNDARSIAIGNFAQQCLAAQQVADTVNADTRRIHITLNWRLYKGAPMTFGELHAKEIGDGVPLKLAHQGQLLDVVGISTGADKDGNTICVLLGDEPAAAPVTVSDDNHFAPVVPPGTVEPSADAPGAPVPEGTLHQFATDGGPNPDYVGDDAPSSGHKDITD